MKMFNLGKTVCIVLALFGLILGQAYAKTSTYKNVAVLKDLTVHGTAQFSNPIQIGGYDSKTILDPEYLYLYDLRSHESILIRAGKIQLESPIDSKAKIEITEDGLVLGNCEHPEVLIDKDDGNLVLSNDVVVSKNIEFVGTSNDIKAESDLNIKSGSYICIGTCDQ